jgi:hypothetical protein
MMIRMKLVWIGACFLSACAGQPTVYDADDPELQRAGSEPSALGGSTSEGRLPVARNRTQWAQFDTEIASARVAKNGLGTLFSLGITVTNQSNQPGTLDTSNWRVRLPNVDVGTPGNDVGCRTPGVEVGSHATVDGTLEFQLGDRLIDLTDAVLIMLEPVGGGDAGERVPLDKPRLLPYPLPLDSLRGHRFPGMRTPDATDSVADFEVLDAHIDPNDVDLRSHAQPDMIYLRIDFRATAVEVGSGGLVLQDDDYSLTIDGTKHSPLNRISKQLASGETVDTFVVFEIPVQWRYDAELEFASPNGESNSVPVELPDLYDLSFE